MDAHLCTGCGACAYLEPDALRMVDVPEFGRRPLPVVSVNGANGNGIGACPGARLQHDKDALDDAPFRGEWGPILELYECWSTDPEVRHRGSSGGVISALSAHAVASGSAVGALQVQAKKDAPLENETVLNRGYDEIIGAAGSRYSPASPCERLDLVESADGRCVVVGKPCDIAATVSASKARPALSDKLALTIGIFCAGTPSTRGTEEVVRRLKTDPADVRRVDYRGEGWPGRFRITTKNGETKSFSYEESWGETLQKHRQWRCMICPDHTGEFADLSVGDPWYRKLEEGEPGRSLVVVRTENGREALHSALRDGALEGHPIPLERLPQSQPNLASTRGAVWARVLTMRLVGLPAPTFSGLPSFRPWLRLDLRTKISSVGGTLKRIKRRGLRVPESRAGQASAEDGAGR
ncbi:Coenzyme F420 hydrogenase/dehydrogenase, beta subunit C-terminal domain [Phytoactinopolyspora halotolerans]|uniref:Coenzyme F420 hydrogenase/dehydrogenase, beta subunit C-terminal domain n=1 Tax=Phytoactinopolyspora halotolerans TaxID=1981512 RepID=UPI001C208416|nr:Coenzyme F420 hydrogenase/dehydrogenase, beta subunit C-terminal domain [Phytoactinopolyspora halotolerans]